LYDHVVSRHYYRFYSDGRVCQNLATSESMDGFDYHAALRENPARCGVYSITPAQVEFQWGNGQKQSFGFERTAARLKIGGGVYLPIATSDGLRLQGTWGYGSYSAQANVSSQHTITFTSDGHFATQGFVGIAVDVGNAAGAASRGTSGSGTYRIAGHTLELTYSDGRHERTSFFRYPSEENSLVISNTFYLRR